MNSRRRMWPNMLLPLLALLMGLSDGLWRQPAAAPKLLDLQVQGIAVDPETGAPVVILEAPATRQAFPMWIGKQEAQAIAIELQGLSTPRPMTHTLLSNILTNLQVKVERIVIHDLRNSTFFASIFLRQGQSSYTIDARPSDAIAQAIAAQAPMFIAPHVLEAAKTLLPPPPETPSAQVGKKFGMHLQTLDEQLARAFQAPKAEGVLVAFVEAHSQAARDGVHRGDIILSVDGHKTRTLEALMAALTTDEPKPHVLRVVRQQRELMIRLQPPKP